MTGSWFTSRPARASGSVPEHSQFAPNRNLAFRPFLTLLARSCGAAGLCMIAGRGHQARLPFGREPMKKLAISLLALGLMQAGAARAQDLTIALVGPITGANAAFGEQMQHGAEAAVKA